MERESNTFQPTGSEQLFQGEPQPLGGLSNETELANNCPASFRQDNPWSNYAQILFVKGASIENWKWKASASEMRWRQFNCLRGLLGTFALGHKDKLAVAGWMLSEMLAEVPEFVVTEK
ncbi:MAG: hypothetical protein WDZ94_01185 [Patescibacteria group bacterium]